MKNERMATELKLHFTHKKEDFSGHGLTSGRYSSKKGAFISRGMWGSGNQQSTGGRMTKQRWELRMRRDQQNLGDVEKQGLATSPCIGN